MSNSFADYLYEKMAQNDWNDSQLARKIGVHRGTVSRWLKEGKQPELANIRKVAKGLSVAIDEVMAAIEGRYKVMSADERDALEILNRYSPQAIKLAASKL